MKIITNGTIEGTIGVMPSGEILTDISKVFMKLDLETKDVVESYVRFGEGLLKDRECHDIQLNYTNNLEDLESISCADLDKYIEKIGRASKAITINNKYIIIEID